VFCDLAVTFFSTPCSLLSSILIRREKKEQGVSRPGDVIKGGQFPTLLFSVSFYFIKERRENESGIHHLWLQSPGGLFNSRSNAQTPLLPFFWPGCQRKMLEEV